MKNFCLITLLLVSTHFLSNAIELERMGFDWEEINVDRTYTSHKIILTNQDEIILGPHLRISYDRGKTFKGFTYTIFDTILYREQVYKVNVNDIGGYAYDKDNGLYLLGYENLTYKDKIIKYSIFYIPPERDTVIQKIEFEINDIESWAFSENEPRSFVLFGNKIIFHSDKNAWNYNILNKSLDKIQFVDSLQNLVKEGKLNSYNLKFTNYNSSDKITDFFYTINNYWRYKYSIDEGLNWIDGKYDANCNIGGVISSMFQWNGIYSWYSAMYSSLYRLDEFCQKYELILDTSYSSYWTDAGMPIHSNGNYLVYSWDRRSEGISRIYYSKNKGDKFYRFENFPIEELKDKMTTGYYPSVFSDGEVLLNFQIKLDTMSPWKLFKGTPKNTSINDNTSINGFNFYPNPAEDYIEISISDIGASPISSRKVQIFDILGIEVMFESIHTMTLSHRINVSGLPTGVYYIKIGDRVEKFLKME